MKPAWATVLLVAAFAAGCGGGGRLSHGEYEHELRRIETTSTAAQRLFLRLVVDDPALPQPACERAAERFHRELNKVVDRVAALKPPSDAAPLQERFLANARISVDRVGELAQEIRAGRLSCGTAFNRRAYGMPSTERAYRAVQELGDRGYRLGLNSD